MKLNADGKTVAPWTSWCRARGIGGSQREDSLEVLGLPRGVGRLNPEDIKWYDASCGVRLRATRRSFGGFERR